MKPNRDLVIIDNRLKSKDNNIFPLSPTHRKELRDILSRNIGDLKIKLNLIKDRKFKEFKQKNKTKFDKIKKVLTFAELARTTSFSFTWFFTLNNT